MNIIVDTCVWSYALRRQSVAEMAVVEELQALIKAFRVQMLGRKSYQGFVRMPNLPS